MYEFLHLGIRCWVDMTQRENAEQMNELKGSVSAKPVHGFTFLFPHLSSPFHILHGIYCVVSVFRAIKR